MSLNLRRMFDQIHYIFRQEILNWYYLEFGICIQLTSKCICQKKMSISGILKCFIVNFRLLNTFQSSLLAIIILW